MKTMPRQTSWDSVFANLGGTRAAGGDVSAPLEESEIAAIESQIGVPLPDDYREFLLHHGGVRFKGVSPDNPYIVFRTSSKLPKRVSKSGMLAFNQFFGKERNPKSDAKSIAWNARTLLGRMPDSVIPIGDDGMEGLICLGIKGAEAGKVYFWDGRNEPPSEDEYLEDYGKPRPPEAMFKNVYLISSSFEEFLNRLEPQAD
jgi:hypothetical protein